MEKVCRCEQTSRFPTGAVHTHATTIAQAAATATAAAAAAVAAAGSAHTNTTRSRLSAEHGAHKLGELLLRGGRLDERVHKQLGRGQTVPNKEFRQQCSERKDVKTLSNQQARW
jgi:hypothetical protein